MFASAPGSRRDRSRTPTTLSAHGMLYVLVGLSVLVLMYIVWRTTRTDRDAFVRDEAVLPLLSPLAIRLAGHMDVAAREVVAVANELHARPVLYEMLMHYGHADLFPSELLTIDEQAKGILAHAVMHPNEQGEPPAAIEVTAALTSDVNNRSAEFRELRFRMKDASNVEWKHAVVGPFFADATPYLNEAESMIGRAADVFLERELSTAASSGDR